MATHTAEAKRRGGNQAANFDDIRDHITVTTSETSAAVRRMIDEHGNTTVFQPIWNLADNSLLGLEALTRPDADYALSGPLEAFDIAQQIRRVHELDALCIKNALTITPDLPADALVIINVCPQTLDLAGDHDDWILDAVRGAGLPTSRIVLEITERFGVRTPSIVKSIARLRHHGFKMALDDVGTGNSGLEMLRQIKADYVKLDRSIVTAAATDPSARAILMATATFARQTGAYVIAEGIEDQDTLAFLHTIDDQDHRPKTIIQGGQGHELGRPSPWPSTTTPHPRANARRSRCMSLIASSRTSPPSAVRDAFAGRLGCRRTTRAGYLSGRMGRLVTNSWTLILLSGVGALRCDLAPASCLPTHAPLPASRPLGPLGLPSFVTG